MRRPGLRHCAVTLASACLALCSLTGCAAGLRVKQIDAAEERPANVLVFFRVTGDDQSGVPGLQETAFEVKEDDHAIGPGVDRVIVNPDLRASQTTMILLDLGGRPSAEDLDALAGAAAVLVDRLGSSRRVALYALDGLPEPQPLAPFGSSADTLKAAAAKIPSYKTRDPSLDLNGGYVSALHTLRQTASPSAGPRIANLILLTRGPDRASRIDQRAVSDEIRKTDIDIRRFAIGYGAEAEKAKIDVFADGPIARVSSTLALREATTKIADAVDERGRSFYLLSYCTAARGGQHKLRLDVSRERTDEGGDKKKVTIDHGSLSYAFKADGFGPGCTPNVPDGWKSDPSHDHVAVVTTQSVKVEGKGANGANQGSQKGGAKPSLAEAIPGR